MNSLGERRTGALKMVGRPTEAADDGEGRVATMQAVRILRQTAMIAEGNVALSQTTGLGGAGTSRLR
ncbi:hypothetical protein N792_05540 [Lysobacter concretionis Ko07 = DSM 16239]|uniref:Uncharacterized protein n=1 Tax=Lysobacter concretionis Ko07 = DSM 16239 TaxID=1122185 RepID=A0A0A0EQN1_9GAMM|nr:MULTISPECIES: hypothetical protein [Lysobacter]KGM52530.1 hypothetical protein N792_05540 [Lysobacter concretionis Ko07 = DSM 16239]QOD91716.1 hypothetical protein H2514_03445 [Lysobacter sp. CW239]